MKPPGICHKYHAPFEDHNLHWWCFFLPKHYTYTRAIDNNGVITDTPLTLWKTLPWSRKNDF